MFEVFLAAVKKEIDEAEPGDVHYCPLQAVGTGTTDASLDSQQYRRQLLDAIRKQNPDKVLELIMKSNKENAKTLRTLNDECRAVALRQKLRSCCIKRLWNSVSACIENCCGKQCCKDEQQPTEDHIEEEKQWIEILSNPLYISLEWLWRIYSKSGRKESTEGRCSTKPTTQSSTSVEIELSDEEENGKNQDQDAYALKPSDARVSTCPKDEGKANEDENQDVIASALRDSHLLEMIAGNDLHQHKDEYEKRANEVEEFAVAVVEGSTREQLIDVMDTKGDGCLKQKKPWNFSQSLSLLKIAADEKRKKFVASAKCESILNEVVYFGCASWQKMDRKRKILWSFLVQLPFLFFSLMWIPYAFYLALKDCPCCNHRESECWKFIRRQFEHPYSKFVNHTISYMVFLGFLITASVEDTFGRTWFGLEWIDWVIIAFVVGLLIQELLAANREGVLVYLSKWWNVVDAVIIILFVVAFMVDSVLGPLQLSLYKMLRDVWKFLLLFLVLHLSFSTGLVKMYNYYVASQVELQRQNMRHYGEKTHHFASYRNTLSTLFWLLLGIYDEEKVMVKDPSFEAMSIAGQIFMIVYVVCMVIVALNMLIAMMNESYERIRDNSVDIWRFSRARMWLEFIDKGNVIPSPLNVPYYILKGMSNLFLVTVRTKCCCLCQCKCEKGGKCKTLAEEDRMKILQRLVVKFLEDRYIRKKKEGESQSTE
ncbi:PREDICTED: short transient receptor potential channel 4-like isoform X2 [Acropora digitifera]|uniref:short transient receptor potential channel 4-like isoform X2 n=1 Tax=Acropora digitifera TaxID=70779 RepID=UPI00077B0B69|nr:PREDICTED: short transient receptor potential channel 4-like isoform X2 [Acropora digitifera]